MGPAYEVSKASHHDGVCIYIDVLLEHPFTIIPPGEDRLSQNSQEITEQIRRTDPQFQLTPNIPACNMH